MLQTTATIKQMFEFINKQLDHADWYESQTDKLPQSLIDDQIKQFRSQAFGIVFFIYSTLGININTNTVIAEYESCKEAGEAIGCGMENIRRVCVGLAKSAKGYNWKYK